MPPLSISLPPSENLAEGGGRGREIESKARLWFLRVVCETKGFLLLLLVKSKQSSLRQRAVKLVWRTDAIGGRVRDRLNPNQESGSFWLFGIWKVGSRVPIQ